MMCALECLYPGNRTLTAWAIFLCIARRPGSTTQEVADRVGVSISSVCRHTADLGFGRPHPDTKRHKPGLKLVRALSDPRDQRRSTFYLTPEGDALLARLEGAATSGRWQHPHRLAPGHEV